MTTYHCPYTVIVWDNAGLRSEYPARDLTGALSAAKGQRNVRNRTVKVAHGDDSIRHWTRSKGAHGNQWSARATAECSR